MLYNYTLYKANGSKEEHLNQKEWDLDALQRAVGGWIEMVGHHRFFGKQNLAEDAEIYVNEEGLLLSLSQNPFFEFGIVGDAILVEVAR